MPLRKRLRRWKNNLFSSSSENASTSSLTNIGQTSPHPHPPPLSRVETPTQTSIPLVHNVLPLEGLSPAAAIVPAPSGAASTVSSPNIVVDAQPSVAAAPPQSPHNTVTPAKQESGPGRAKMTGWAGLKTLLNVLESSTNAFGPLKSTIGRLNQCIDIYEQAARGRDDYKELRTKLDSLLEDLNPLLGGQIPPAMTKSIENLCNEIGKELQLVKDKQDRGATRRYAEAMSDSEQVLECYRRISDHLERLTLNAELNTWKVVYEQATDARLDRLSPAHSAVYDSSKSSAVQRGPCASGTRKEELIKLQRWARSGNSSDIYWMNGMAGTGKTTIAYSLCEGLENTGELGASFFCSRSMPECRKVELILPSIAYQLARFSRPFRSALSRILESNPDAHQRSLGKQFNALISNPLLEIEELMPSAVVVVIDALDECENENAVGQILEVLLVDGRPSKLPVRFLISSRPEPAIYPRMMKQVGNDLGARLVLHELATATVKGDIKTYLHKELKDVPLTSKQLAALAERSGVLFIYASTAARYIKDGLEFMEHEERLSMILGLLPPSADGKDRDIDALYTSILEAAVKNKQLDESVRVRMKTVLHTVICAQEPISLGGLAGLLRLKSSKQVEALLRPLRSVVNITEMDGVVTVLHASFPDFMFDHERSVIFYCDPTAHHGQIAKACLGTIEKNGQFNVCQFKSSYLRDIQVTNLNERADQSVSSELFYACRYWITHLELGTQHTDLDKLLYEFLTLRLLLWMEVLNVKRSMHLGARIMQRVENYIQAKGYSEEMSQLAHDAWRFVVMFTGHAVSQSTPHIYISMLPFWPESGPIAKHYKKQMQGAIKVQGTAITGRQHALLATWSFEFHNDVRSACFSPDGSLIAFGAMRSVYVIDGTTGRTAVDPLQHEGPVTSVAFSPNGALIASGSTNKTIRVWNAQSGQTVIGPLTGHAGAIDSISFSADCTRIVSGSNDMTIRVWDLQTGDTLIEQIRCEAWKSHSVCFSPDGTRIVSACANRTLRAWDTRTGLISLGPLKGHTNGVTCVCFSPDNTRIVSGSEDMTIRVWSAQDGQMVGNPLKGHSGHVLSVAFAPDGRYVVSGSSDNTIRLWDLKGDLVSARILHGHTGPVTSVAFSSDGSRIASCSDDKTIRVWDTRSRATVADSPEGHTEAVTSVGYSPDSKYIVSSSVDKTIRMWDAESGQTVGRPLEGHTGQVKSVSFSPDGTYIVSGSDDQTIRVWDVRSGYTILGPLEGHTEPIFSVSFSPNGSLIVSGSLDHTIRVWGAKDGKLVGSPLKGHTDDINSVAFSPDSMRVVSGSDDMTVRVWDVQSSQTIVGPLQGHICAVYSVCFSPDGARIASGSEDMTIRVWDVQNGQMIFNLPREHTDTVRSICFSPDGTLIVSGSYDRTVQLWDAQSGRAVGGPLVGHTGPVYSVAFSPDGVHVVSGSKDQTIRVWDVRGIFGMQGAEDLRPSHDSAPFPHPRPHQSWVLQEDGWMVDAQSHLLVWVPPDLHPPAPHPHALVISNKGSLELDLSSAKLGESWAQCYQPLSP